MTDEEMISLLEEVPTDWLIWQLRFRPIDFVFVGCDARNNKKQIGLANSWNRLAFSPDLAPDQVKELLRIAYDRVMSIEEGDEKSDIVGWH